MKNNNKGAPVFGLTVLSMALLLIFLVAAFAAENDFQNWCVQQTGNTWVYSPSGLGQGKFFNITLFPAVEIGNNAHRGWFCRFVALDEGRLGKVTRRRKLNQDNRHT